jgi:DNA-binding CsgD family transcriptional regulator
VAQGGALPLDKALALTLTTAAESPCLAAPYPAGLTAREAEVLRLVAEGLTNAQVAERLFVAPRTVNAHLTSVYAKLRVEGRPAAIRRALDLGLR